MLSGVVLAGGMGTRMGVDKGLVTVGSKPMFLHVVDAVSALTQDIVVSVGRGMLPAYEDRAGRGVILVEDRAKGLGPLEGLSNGFRRVKGDYVVVAPCDTPLLRPELLRLLASRAGGRDGAVPEIGGYLEPLVAVYRRTAVGCFERELENGIGKVGNALAGMDIRLVGEDELRSVDPDLLSLRNINSPEDLDAVREMLD